MCVVISTLLSFFLTSVEFQISNIKLQKIMIKNEMSLYIKLFVLNLSFFFIFFFFKKKKKKKKKSQSINPLNRPESEAKLA
jgi:positive regulator of sigma E activity